MPAIRKLILEAIVEELSQAGIEVDNHRVRKMDLAKVKALMPKLNLWEVVAEPYLQALKKHLKPEIAVILDGLNEYGNGNFVVGQRHYHVANNMGHFPQPKARTTLSWRDQNSKAEKSFQILTKNLELDDQGIEKLSDFLNAMVGRGKIWIRGSMVEGAWTKEDHQSIYSTRPEFWAELKQTGGSWDYTITNGKTVFYQSGPFGEESTAKKSAKDIYDDLVKPAPKLPKPRKDRSKWEVTLPGQPALVVEAMSPLQALAIALYKSPDYSYEGLTVGPNREYLRLIHYRLFKTDGAKIKRVD